MLLLGQSIRQPDNQLVNQWINLLVARLDDRIAFAKES